MDVDSRPLSAKGDDCVLGVSGTSSKDGPEADTIFSTGQLGPVRFWGDSPKASAVLQPGIELFDFDNISEEEGEASRHDKKGKKKMVSRSTKVS